MAVAIDFADSKMSDGRRCRNDRRWKLHARTTLVKCWSNDKEVSSVTPSGLTASVNWISAPATLMVWLKSTPTSRCLVANNTASVLPGFNSSAFWWNHSETASEQRTSGDRSSSCDAVKHQVVRVLMMVNAKSVDHLPYRRHVHRKEQRTHNKAQRDSRGEHHGFRPLRIYLDLSATCPTAPVTY